MRRIIAAIIIAIGCDALPAIWPNIEQAWDVYAICVRIEVLLWLLVLCSFIPYTKLASKSTLVALCTVEFVNTLFMVVSWGAVQNPYFLYAFKTVFCGAFVLRFLWRNYDKGSDELNETHFFIVGIRPRGLQDFFLSLIKEPIGGIGVYAKGKYYYYRHGRLTVGDKNLIKRKAYKYRIIKRDKIDPNKIEVLESLIGSKYSRWSLLINCKTVLEPTISKRGKPIFYRKEAENDRR